MNGFGTPRHIGTLLLTKYLFPFEAASLLLLIAAVGAVVLARRRRGLEGGEEAPLRIRTTEPGWAGTMAEGAGVRSTAYEELLTPTIEAEGSSPNRNRPAPAAGDGRAKGTRLVAIGWYLVVSS